MTPWAGCLRHWRKPLRALSAGRRGVHVNYPLGNPAGTTSATKGVMRTVVYDQAGRILGEYNANGKPLYETVYFGDMPVAAVEPMGGVPTVFYVYADHLDTARVIVRASDQKIAWTWGSNEPFGQSQAVVNPNGLSNLGGFVYNPRFPGQVADSESGWFYNWHRDYDPGKGRYVQRGMASAMGSGTGSTPTERCPMPRTSRT